MEVGEGCWFISKAECSSQIGGLPTKPQIPKDLSLIIKWHRWAVFQQMPRDDGGRPYTDMGEWPGCGGYLRPWRGLQGRLIWLCCCPGTTPQSRGQAPSWSLHLRGAQTHAPVWEPLTSGPRVVPLSAVHPLLLVSVPCPALVTVGGGHKVQLGHLRVSSCCPTPRNQRDGHSPPSLCHPSSQVTVGASLPSGQCW